MRAHRFLLLVMGLVTVCHCGARSSFDTGSTAAPAPTGLTAQEFVDAFPEAFCERYAGCCERADQTLDQCLDTQREVVRERAQDPALVFDPERASECLGGLRSWSGDHDLCRLRPDEQFAPCWHVFDDEPAARYPGESCETTASCVGLSTPRCGLDENTGQRYCQVSPYVDTYTIPGPCRTDSPGIHARVFDCQRTNRVCSLTRDVCSYERGIGEPCGSTHDCRDHLFCSKGACIQAPGPGEACLSNNNWDEICDAGLRCHAGVCLVIDPVTIGEACSTGNLPVRCDEGACVAGVCRDVHPYIPEECGLPWSY